jgi:hypothetical protein
VAEPYGDIVYLGAGVDGFLAACERALSASQVERAARTNRMRVVLESTSWSQTARAMELLIDEARERRQAERSVTLAALQPAGRAQVDTPIGRG